MSIGANTSANIGVAIMMANVLLTITRHYVAGSGTKTRLNTTSRGPTNELRVRTAEAENESDRAIFGNTGTEAGAGGSCQFYGNRLSEVEVCINT